MLAENPVLVSIQMGPVPEDLCFSDFDGISGLSQTACSTFETTRKKCFQE
jgi:hypothetical protein